MIDMQGMIVRTRVLIVACVLAMLTLVVGLAWAQQAAPAQPSPNAMPIDVDRGASGLTRWLHALRTRASVLMITAHPDDEDGGMLAFETRGAGARAALLTLNRGEGPKTFVITDTAYDGDGRMINSRFLDGMTIAEAKEEVARRLEKEKRRQSPVGAAPGQFPAARLGHFASALLGLPDPGHSLRNAAWCRCRKRICR